MPASNVTVKISFPPNGVSIVKTKALGGKKQSKTIAVIGNNVYFLNVDMTTYKSRAFQVKVRCIPFLLSERVCETWI